MIVIAASMLVASMRTRRACLPMGRAFRSTLAAPRSGGDAFDIPVVILYDILIEDAMERINLNVPSDVRRRLRAIAKRLDRSEAETARDLLIHALELAERNDFYERVASAMTPEMRERMLEIHEALEDYGG